MHNDTGANPRPTVGIQLLTITDVARRLRVKPRTVRRWLETDPEFPHPFPIHGEKSPRWDADELREWELLQKVRAREAERLGANADRTGHLGTSAKPTDLPARRKGKGK